MQFSPLRNSDGYYGDSSAYYYFVYPNILLNILPDRLQTNHIVPNDHDYCFVEFDHYYTNDVETQSRIHNAQPFAHKIQQEDIVICEHVKKGLMSGTYEVGRLSPKRESSVWHFYVTDFTRTL